MKKAKNQRSWLLILALFGLLAAFVVPRAIIARSMAKEASGPEAKVERLVLDKLAAESETDFFVWMTEKADLSPAAALATKEEKGQFVFDTLRATAEATQKELRGYLDAQGISYRPFYIANKIYVESGNLEAVLSIAAREDVAQITANHAFQLQEPFIDPNPAIESVEGIESNIAFVNADDVWALGYDGSGMVLAGNDTGLDWDHPALINQYRGWDGSTADHNYNWWDATGTYPMVPDDGHGHGTHTTGTMVGDDGGSNQIGVAPGAQTIHCKNMTNGGNGDDFTFSTCFEWDLAPWDLSGNNPMPSLAPDAVNNSWGYFGGNAAQFEDEIAALRAAGIVVEVSAGNEGSGCATLRSPGDYHQSLTTGSVNHFGTFPGTITGFSSRGPSDLYPGEFIPDIMAPGESINSSLPGGGYSGPTWSGTSMAGPHVTALVALMWDASPGIAGDVALTEQIIIDTAVPLTGQNGSNCGGNYTDGPNNDWGYGTMDSLAAVQMAIALGGPFSVTATPASLDICVPADALYNVEVALNEAFTDPVELDAVGEPAGTTVSFSPNNQVPPFSSVLTIGNTGSAAPGSYDIDIVGTSGSEESTATVTLNVFDDTPGVVSLVSPADGATDVGLVPEFEWMAATQSGTYLLEVADDAGFSNIVYNDTVEGTTHVATAALDEETTYYWRVTPENACGAGSASATYSFTTTNVPDVLLVDDDDNSPNVQATYTAALDALGVEYDVWDTNNTDNEPSAAELAPYRTVIWFTGDEFGGVAGPGSTGEAALAAWLDTGRCLFISSQDYYYDRGKTSFMDTYLGVNTATSDVTQTSVTGAGSVFSGLGPFTLSYPFNNYSDTINPDGAPAELAFSGTAGNAAVNKDSGVYRTTFWGFPWEAINTAANREAALQTTLDWCAALPLYDVDLSGNQSSDGQPGDTVEYVVTITNDGNVDDTFDLTVSGETWTTTLSTSSISLSAGDSDTFTVSVEIPGGAAPGDSDTATVTATSTGNAGVSDSMNVTTSVPDGQQTYGVNLSGDTVGGGAAGDVLSYEVTVTNTGNGSDTFNLTISGYAWTTTLSDNSVSLGAGESTVVTVEVTIPGDAGDGDADTVTVTATSTGDAGVSDTHNITTTVGGPNYQTFLPLMLK